MLNKKKSLAALFAALLLCTTFSQETSALSNQAQTPAAQTTNASAIQLTPAQQLEQWRSQYQLAQSEIMALLWMKTSAEYRALCYQGYNVALLEIDRALANKKPGGKPLAIVLDCDETVTDNVPAMAKAVADNNGQFKSLWWREVVHRGESGAMPGAAEFLQTVHKKGLDIFYVSNRKASVNYDATEKNLRELKFPQADSKHILLMEDSGNKQLRYDKITADYDVVLYMGDNAGDLPIGVSGKDLATRNALVDSHQKSYGTKFIMFPNPAYGGWVSALAKNYLGIPLEERTEVNQKKLLGK